MDPRDLFSRKEAQYGLPAGHLDAMYAVESGRGRNLYNRSSGATGPFQFMASTAKQFGVTDRMDLAQSTEGAAKLAAHAAKLLAKQGLPVTPENLYLVHQQGAGAAPALLNAPTKAALDVLAAVYGNRNTAAKAITGNGGRLDMSAGDFANHVASTYLSKSGRQPSKSAQTQTPARRPPSQGPAPNSFAAALRKAASSAVPTQTRSFLSALEDLISPSTQAPSSSQDGLAQLIAKLGGNRPSSAPGQ